jgi:quercetin dioxygenase-like cupin family protein
MERTQNVALVIVVMTGLIAGYAMNLESPAAAQRETTGSLPPPPEWKSQRPAPYLHTGNLTMWPNQPTDGTHWSIDDIRKSHQAMADAESTGKSIDPNSTLHDFPYWTRTHSMFLYHVPQVGRGKRAEQHIGYSQFIVVMGGTGTLQVGGTLSSPAMLEEKGAPIWGELRGTTVVGGTTFNLKEGDWVSIPPNTPSYVKATGRGGVSYMVMKINAGLFPWELVR